MKINIDVGHGSNTAGKRTPPIPAAIDINGDGKSDIKKGEQLREHIANVGVAVFLVKELERCGFDTMRTGWDDADATNDSDAALSARQTAIAKANCDYSISIHFNAFGDGKSFNSAQGVGIYIHNKYMGQSEALAKVILKHLAGGSKQTNRGVTKKSLAMCNCNNMDVKGAILVELAFMTNLREATELMANEAFWKECAQEIVRGVCEYTGVKYVPELYIPTVQVINQESATRDIVWLQEQLNKTNPYTIPVTGKYDAKTRIAALMFAETKKWNWDDATGWQVGTGTVKALSKL